MFEIYAYDKDAGIYDKVMQSPSQKLSERVAISLQKLINKGGYVRHSNSEPYDWVEILDKDGNVVYSKELEEAMNGGSAA